MEPVYKSPPEMRAYWRTKQREHRHRSKRGDMLDYLRYLIAARPLAQAAYPAQTA